MLTAFLLFALESGRQRAVKMPVQQATGWNIQVMSTGGFGGGGAGSMTVSSDGAIVMLDNPRCKFQLTPSELQSLDAAVKAAQPATWMECYSLADINTHCCDLIHWTVTLSTAGGRNVYSTSFYMITPAVPLDLDNILELLIGPAGLHSRYRTLCATTP